jgi:hypothetical protein
MEAGTALDGYYKLRRKWRKFEIWERVDEASAAK